MIETKTRLKEILDYEKKLYVDDIEGEKGIKAFIKSHPNYHVWKYVKLLRKTGYYYSSRRKNIFYLLKYFYFCRRKNILGRKLGIELNERTFDKGLIIYHTQGIVLMDWL